MTSSPRCHKTHENQATMSSSPVLAIPAASAASKHIVLVHGTGHGGWCWYKVATLLRAAGHRVTTPDLAASGIDARRLDEVPTFEDYSRPLLDLLRALPPGERVVLVGHSYGGMNIALAAEMFPEKVAAAVFVTAFLPDCTSPRPTTAENLPIPDWLDTVTDPQHVPPSLFLGPEFLRQKLYQLCPPEDITLGLSLARVSSYYVADLHSQPPFSQDRYGSVSKVYVICSQDLAMFEDYQRSMITNFPVNEVKEILTADHMAMFSAPQELSWHLADVANKYV